MKNGFGYRDERRPSFVLAFVGALALALALGCATGTVTTAYGPRSAAEVQAQDTVADILQSLDAAYAAAVAIHDDPATVAAEAPALHAAKRATLITQHDGLTSAWDVLMIWKKSSNSSYSPASVIQPVVASLPSFLALAVDTGAMKQADADKVAAFVKTVFPGGAQ